MGLFRQGKAQGTGPASKVNGLHAGSEVYIAQGPLIKFCSDSEK